MQLAWHSILIWEKRDGRFVGERGQFRVEIALTGVNSWESTIFYQNKRVAGGISMRATLSPAEALKTAMRSAVKMAIYHGMPLSDVEKKVYGPMIEAGKANDYRVINGERKRVAHPIVERLGHLVQVPRSEPNEPLGLEVVEIKQQEIDDRRTDEAIKIVTDDDVGELPEE